MNGVVVLVNDFKFDDSIDLNKQDVPYQMFWSGSHIEILGNRKLDFEGKYKILEYSSNQLKIKRPKGIINIIGDNLTIGNVHKSAFTLTGNIENILFE